MDSEQHAKTPTEEAQDAPTNPRLPGPRRRRVTIILIVILVGVVVGQGVWLVLLDRYTGALSYRVQELEDQAKIASDLMVTADELKVQTARITKLELRAQGTDAAISRAQEWMTAANGVFQSLGSRIGSVTPPSDQVIVPDPAGDCDALGGSWYTGQCHLPSP